MLIKKALAKKKASKKSAPKKSAIIEEVLVEDEVENEIEEVEGGRDSDEGANKTNDGDEDLGDDVSLCSTHKCGIKLMSTSHTTTGFFLDTTSSCQR